MNISGIYIKAWPATLPAVQQRLKNIPGVEIHATTDDGKLIATVETDGVGSMADAVTHIEQVEGVLSATLVYHHDEPNSDSNSLAGEAR
jgi:periplasmic nitrate reductase NapD